MVASTTMRTGDLLGPRGKSVAQEATNGVPCRGSRDFGHSRRSAGLSLLALLLLMGLPLASCGSTTDTPDNIGQCPSPAESVATPAAPTYVEDVAVIMARHCATCHGAAAATLPLLNNYAAVTAAASAVIAALDDGSMPPAAPNACCQEYLTDRQLSLIEASTVRQWVTDGMPEGVLGVAGTAGEVDDADGWLVASSGWAPQLKLAQNAPYTPKARPDRDDVRCFLWAAQREAPSTMLGYRIRHTSTLAVRNAIYRVDADRVEEFQALDAADPEPGWDCSASLTQDAGNLLGAARVDGTPRRLPGGVGRPLPATSQVVGVVQYATAGIDVAELTEDSPSLELMLSDRADRVATNLIVANPFWVLSGGMPIPAGAAQVVHRYTLDANALYTNGESFDILAVSLQMHDLGTGASLVVERADGTTECLASYSDWNTRGYTELLMATNVRVNDGDRLTVECRWQSLAASESIEWGADGEVCLATVTYVPSKL